MLSLHVFACLNHESPIQLSHFVSILVSFLALLFIHAHDADVSTLHNLHLLI